MASASYAATPKKEKPPKPKYNMFQNSWFMVSLAWKTEEKKVVILSLLTAVLAVAHNLVNLYVSPTILSVLERKASMPELIWTIVLFTAALIFVSAAAAYINRNILFGKITVRNRILSLLNRKSATTSYPNLNEDKFKKLLAASSDAVSGNSEATEAIWQTLSSLLTNVLGFVIYISLLKG